MTRKRFIKLCMGKLKLTRNTANGFTSRKRSKASYCERYDLLKNEAVPKLLDMICTELETPLTVKSISIDMRTGNTHVKVGLE